ncbi:MAG: hypothetical protein AAF468_11965 [Pseudomonadota bacterium]
MTSGFERRTIKPANAFFSPWLGLAIIVGGLLLGLRFLAGESLEFLPRPASDTIIYGWLATSLIILALQCFAAIRLKPYLGSGADIRSLGTMVNAAIAVTVFWTALQALDALSRSSPDRTGIIASSVQKPTLPLLQGGKAIVIETDISFETSTALKTMLQDHPDLRLVVFDSNGGRIFAARALARTILAHQLNTHVKGKCHSACTIAFMAGNERSMAEDGTLGFHRYKLERESPLKGNPLDVEMEKDRRFFTERGVSKFFLSKIFLSNHENIWRPARSELISAGVLNQ